MQTVLDASDEISRCIIFARHFRNSVHINDVLWQFDNSDEHGVSHESGVLRRLAPEPEDVHSIGCAIAAAQNERSGEAPGPKRRYYCGFRTASFAALPLEGDGYTIEITVKPEHGVEAHVDIALTIHVTGKSARATRRMLAGLSLADHFGPPDPHRCACDDDDENHPFDVLGPECLIEGLKDKWPALQLRGISAGSENPAAAGDDPDNPLLPFPLPNDLN